MTSVDHEDRPAGMELVGPVEDAGAELVQRSSAAVERLDQTPAEASTTDAELVPVDPAPAELVRVEGRPADPERRPPAAPVWPPNRPTNTSLRAPKPCPDAPHPKTTGG